MIRAEYLINLSLFEMSKECCRKCFKSGMIWLIQYRKLALICNTTPFILSGDKCIKVYPNKKASCNAGRFTMTWRSHGSCGFVCKWAIFVLCVNSPSVSVANSRWISIFFFSLIFFPVSCCLCKAVSYTVFPFILCKSFCVFALDSVSAFVGEYNSPRLTPPVRSTQCL